MKRIFEDINEFKKHLDENWPNQLFGKGLVVTSGGFDPVHIGHLRCIQESSRIADDLNGILVVIVNGDGFLRRKKGRAFMSHAERMEIIAGLHGVDYVVGYDDGTQTVEGAIEILEPAVFTKGGDRTDKSNVPEWEVCARLGCEIKFGVGGGKIQSSSDLISKSNDDVDLVSLSAEAERISRESQFVTKPWGSEEILVNTEKYVAKILTIRPGCQLSRQYHEVKDETIVGMSGICVVEIGKGNDIGQVFIEKGNVRRILPGTVHRFKHWSGDVKLLEISTPELDDVVRIEDDYGRA